MRYMPLYNAHAHLDLRPSRPIGQIDKNTSIAAWTAEVVRFRQSDAYQPETAIRAGLAESARAGVGEIADIYQFGVPFTAYLEPGFPRCRLFLEWIAWRPDQIDAAIQKATTFLDTIPSPLLPGLSPHAPYTTHPALLDEAVRLSNRHGVPLTMHLAESREEMQLIHDKNGPLLERMLRADPTYDPHRNLLDSPLEYLKRLAAADHILIVHANYLTDQEMLFLDDNADRFSVVFCPRSHRHLGHDRFPLEKMLKYGVRVLLGTDSRASCPDLDLNNEIHLVRQLYPDISHGAIEEIANIS